MLMTGLGAWFRVWGSAYVGAGVVQSTSMHGQSMLVDGPFRHTRNPLYLGTLLHTCGLAILMPPSGAVFTIATIWILQFRLALAEEPFLAAQFGQAYVDYCARVPRFLPVIAAQMPPTGAKPNWLLAVVGEIYFVGAFATLVVFGWSFNADPIKQGFLISLGAWLIAIALIPRARKSEAETGLAKGPTLRWPSTRHTWRRARGRGRCAHITAPKPIPMRVNSAGSLNCAKTPACALKIICFISTMPDVPSKKRTPKR